jgi:hypothetical protein
MVLLYLISLLIPSEKIFYLVAQPDTNFKSIHQLQYEEYKKDTTKNMIKGDSNIKNSEGIFGQKQPMQTIINLSLMMIIIIVLITGISIFLIARRIYLTKK